MNGHLRLSQLRFSVSLCETRGMLKLTTEFLFRLLQSKLIQERCFTIKLPAFVARGDIFCVFIPFVEIGSKSNIFFFNVKIP